MRILDLNDVKVALASVSGLGNWLLEIDTLMKFAISAASLVYIIMRCVYFKRNNKDD